MKAGKLKSTTLEGLLNASYDKKVKKVEDFEQDRDLSTKTSKVYVNPKTGQTVVAHKGTSGVTDWANNAVYALTGEEGYKKTSRFKEAERVQRNAEKKYGDKNITTIGHSQGGLQAELLGKNTKEIITLNKATRPFGNKPSSNQYDIRTEGDLVSSLNPFQKQKNVSTIESDLNPLEAHAIETLSSVDTEYGTGMRLGLNNITSDSDIDEMLYHISNYHGCFVKNELPEILENGFYVVNLNGQSHWCALQKEGDIYFWFDSYGFPAPIEVMDRIDMDSYFWSNQQIQDLDSTACGYYCVAYVFFMNQKMNPFKSFDQFCKLFNKDTNKNDKILKVLLTKYL